MMSGNNNQTRRGPWTPEEDKHLLNVISQHGGPENWVKISDMMQGRSPKQCRERYHQNLKPSLIHTPITEDEGEVINQLVSTIGRRWAEIARRLPGRSDNAVKNWWNGGANKRIRATRQSNDRSRLRIDHHQHASDPSSQASRSYSYAVQPIDCPHHGHDCGYCERPATLQRQLPLPDEFPPRYIPRDSFQPSHQPSRRNLPPPPLQLSPSSSYPPPSLYSAPPYWRQPIASPGAASIASHGTPSLIADQSPATTPTTPDLAPRNRGHSASQSYDGTHFRQLPMPVETRAQEPAIRNDSLIPQVSPVGQKLPAIGLLIGQSPQETSPPVGHIQAVLPSQSHRYPSPPSPSSADSPTRGKINIASLCG